MKITKEFTVENESGLHARPSASFVKQTSKFKSSIEVFKGDETVDGKSILGLMCLAAGKGSKLKIVADGVDAEDAIYAISALFNSKFGEQK
jgi:phosphocarrier protein HPr